MAMYPDTPGEFFFVLIVSGGLGTGAFFYSPAPGFGNLSDSIQDTPGFIDPYGNACLEDFAAYGTSGGKEIAANLTEGFLQFASAPTQAGPYTAAGSIQFTPGLTGTHSGFISIGGPNGTTALVLPSGDTTGTDDFNAISQALTAAKSAVLLPGIYYLNAKITVTAGTLSGQDMATVVQPGTGYAGVLLAAGNKGVIRNLSVQNSATDAITVAGGISEVWLEDLYFASNTGFCINWTVTGTVHGRIRGIRGAGGATANGGGVAINGGTGAARSAQININDIDVQNCQTSEVLLLSAVTDVTASEVNGSIAAGVAANGITVQGACQTDHLTDLDVGGGAGTGVCVLQAAGGNSPSDCLIQGKLQSGAVGLVVNDATARCRFLVDCTRNQGDGAQFNGTGALNKLFYMGNLNNQAAGTAYDINVTSTVHLFIDAPQCSGGPVTANCNITQALNHVSVTNVPGGFTFAGQAQAGW